MKNFICRLCGSKEYIHNYDVFYCASCGVVFKNVYMFSLPQVKIKMLSKNGKMPIRAKDGDVGYDMFSAESIWIPSGEVIMVHTDISIELPLDTEAQIRSRSGMAKNGIMVANQPGTIDAGYRGPCNVLLYNSTLDDYYVEKGDKIAQMLITTKLPYDFIEVDELEDTERGQTGFGSTGK